MSAVEDLEKSVALGIEKARALVRIIEQSMYEGDHDAADVRLALLALDDYLGRVSDHAGALKAVR